MSLPEPELTLTKTVDRPNLLQLPTMAAMIAGFLLKINNQGLLHIKQSCYPCVLRGRKGMPPNALTMHIRPYAMTDWIHISVVVVGGAHFVSNMKMATLIPDLHTTAG